MGIGESGFPSMAIYFDELFNTLADDHGGAQSQLCVCVGGGGEGGLHGARDIPSSCIMRKNATFC